MHYLPPADRAFDVVRPVTVYRQVGRRPSQVYVDDGMNPVAAGQRQNRLYDLVYWRTTAAVGDQIQQRPGSTLLLTASGRCFPILLSVPQPLRPETAFTHAQTTALADSDEAERLAAQGDVRQGMPRRAQNQVSRGAKRLYDERHPLVVETPPEDLDSNPIEPRRAGMAPAARGRRAT